MPTRSPTGSDARMTLLRSATLIARWPRRSSASSAPLRPSRAATKTVLSPAIVPATSVEPGGVDRVGERRGEPARSHDHAEVPGGREPARPAAQGGGQLVEPAQVGGARQRVHEPPRFVPHLHETELRDVPRDGRLHGLDAGRVQRLGDLGLRRERLLLDEPEDRALALELRGHWSHLREQIDGECGLVGREGQRRGQAQRALAGAADHEPVAERRFDHRPGRPVELDGEQQAEAAHLAELRQCAREEVRCRANLREQRVVDRLDDGAGCRTRDGIAAERRGVVAGLEAGRRVVGDEQRADRQAVREPLRERDCMRLDAESLPREERAGAPDAGLHLVEDQQRAVLVGERARFREGLGRERMHAALALHRLEQDRRGLRPDVLGERLRRREHDAGDERLERGALRRLAGDGQRAERAAVERALERDELASPGRLAGPLERRLDRLGARVAEERVRAAEARPRAAPTSSCIGSVE